MSIQIMSVVWEMSELNGTKLLVMLALADHANDQGKCWPALATIAQKARCSKRHCRRILRELEKEGYLNAEERDGESTVYIVHPDPGQNVLPTPDIAVSPTPDIAMSPEPSRTIKREEEEK